MSFKEIKNIKKSYKTLENDDIVKDFLVPVMKLSTSYLRAVGYFSSGALVLLLQGIRELIENGGKIKVITSPQLQENDVLAIVKGYKDREEVAQNAFLTTIQTELENDEYVESYSLLYHLIKHGFLELKIATIQTDRGLGIYHEKIGLLEDETGEMIAFDGSLNETYSAYMENYESINVFCSWKSDFECELVEEKHLDFKRLWDEEHPAVQVSKVEESQFETVIDKIKAPPKWLAEIIESKSIESEEEGFSLPNWLSLRPYQKDAIANWKEHGYRGIFSMATGTGKTLTGLAAAEQLYRDKQKLLGIVIVVPYQHLVTQWVEDIEQFGIQPIIGFSASPQRNWRNQLNSVTRLFNYKTEKDPMSFCFITTNATFRTEAIQKMLRRLKRNVLLIADEAHNLGAEHLQKALLPNAEYRLALSATINRKGDVEGTESLHRYFGDVVMEYSLKDAINSKMLTPYNYYPIPVYLTEDERHEYLSLTRQIARSIIREKSGKIKFTETAKMLLIKRARIVAGAENKLEVLKKEIERYKDDSQILVYCGATTINDPSYVEGVSPEEEVRQIDAVSKMLGNDLGMKVARFTAQENQQERKLLIDTFSKGEHLQVLTAIRCLDEGVNIPSVEKAFILASSTNPKEYVQRRGRVLRLYEGKERADIYDFITLPFSERDSILPEEIASTKSLIVRELKRLEDFASIALNRREAFEVSELIRERYSIEAVDMERKDLV
ncbi:DEAD/DEAH box helicase family protein [Savagea faecisuis]|uniref:DEAD/DEAH box helicase family protein n=1 Tax=Savagea faecisuis TaxID=1274803 RepID=A0ABW3GY55_9BACL